MDRTFNGMGGSYAVIRREKGPMAVMLLKDSPIWLCYSAVSQSACQLENKDSTVSTVTLFQDFFLPALRAFKIVLYKACSGKLAWSLPQTHKITPPAPPELMLMGKGDMWSSCKLFFHIREPPMSSGMGEWLKRRSGETHFLNSL